MLRGWSQNNKQTFLPNCFSTRRLLHRRAHATDLQNEINVINLVIQMNACSYAGTATRIECSVQKKSIDWCLHSSNKRNTVYCWWRTHLLRKPCRHFFSNSWIVLHPNCLFVLSPAKWDSYAFSSMLTSDCLWQFEIEYMRENSKCGCFVYFHSDTEVLTCRVWTMDRPLVSPFKLGCHRKPKKIQHRFAGYTGFGSIYWKNNKIGCI